MKTSASPGALVALILCLHSAAALRCWSSYNVLYQNQTLVNCSSDQTLCFSSVSLQKENYTFSTWRNLRISKGCASSELCSSPGVHFSSFKLENMYHHENTTCCDTDECNSANGSVQAPPAGSLQCYNCDPRSTYCSENVTCDSGQICFNTSVESGALSLPVHGCASENLCHTNRSLLSNHYSLTAPVSCCNTSHCNVPDSSLQCMTCSDRTCSSQRPILCPRTSVCLTYIYSGFYSYGNYSHNYTSVFKGCSPPERCSPGYVSYNTSFTFHIQNQTCCDSDNCNAPDVILSPPAGSLRCFGCEPNKPCTFVSCNGLEVCGNSTYSYGCFSENLCHASNISFSSLSCCNTSYCNLPANYTAPTTPAPTTPAATTPAPTVGVTGAAQRVLPAALLLCLLQLCFHTQHFHFLWCL